MGSEEYKLNLTNTERTGLLRLKWGCLYPDIENPILMEDYYLYSSPFILQKY